MALVIIQTPQLSASQKKRIGEQVLETLHAEGVPAASVAVLFQPEQSDLYLEGGAFFEAERPALNAVAAPVPAAAVPAREAETEAAFKTRPRRTRKELGELKQELVALLQKQGSLTSFQAQEGLDLKDCDWAPATLRRLFAELEAENAITKQGQKRGTRYVWSGQLALSGAPAPILVKREDGEAPSQE